MTATDLMPALSFPAATRRHRWGDLPTVYIAACDAPDGNGRTERTCSHCAMVRITVHYAQGFPEREWRTAAGAVWHGDATPPCLDQVSA
jgi:hypothetical protein